MPESYLKLEIPDTIKAILDNCYTSKNSFNFQKFNLIKTSEIDEFLDANNITSSEMFNIYKYNLIGIPLCHTCGKRIHISGSKNSKYCCRKCQSLDPENKKKVSETWKKKTKDELKTMMEKRKETCIEKYGTEAYCQTDEWKERYRNVCLEKYGVEGYSQTDEWKEKYIHSMDSKTDKEKKKIREKTKQTTIEKYGVEYFSQTDEWKEKYKKTMMEKYGVEISLHSEELLKKRKETCLERYGCESIFQSEEIKEKIKKTNLEKYGVEYIGQSQEIQDKIRKTNLKHCGYEYNLSSPETKEKSKETCLERYGVEYFSQTDEWKEKYKKTSNQHYGTDFPFKSKEVQEKYIQTSMKKYGVKWATQSEEYKEIKFKNSRKRNYVSNKTKLSIKGIEILSDENEYVENRTVRYKCNVCGTNFESEHTNFQKVRCPECSKSNTVSKEENILVAYIRNLGNYKIITNDRTIIKPKELDIYIPEKKLAIEFNGDYWHNEEKVGKYYHQEKSLACREQNIRLIHIFEHEWINKQNICASIIKSSLGIYDKVVYARNCAIKYISSNDYRNFLDENHLQGNTNSSIRYGLYYQDELVAVIGFGKSRFKSGEMELHRFCCKLNYHIPGAFSKLIKHSNIFNFITYVDLAHFTGDRYKKLGFEEISVTEPNYKWVKGNTTLNRFATQKHKLAKLLENYDENLTEAENMEMNGYYQLFDSGNLKFKYIF